MSIQALQQIRDSLAQLFKRSAAAEADIAELKRQLAQLQQRPTLTLPKK